ncbi:AP2/ERF and B3 domain-containing transcription factor At1g50680-like [Primulina huaijiensis]|uniref:AP2/ERF and B3 domain-containing transcription factor At1g50680-like n=1 Tax=Primulina huaijiensis TaxID=1492673 RepID=UPI003CC74416
MTHLAFHVATFLVSSLNDTRFIMEEQQISLVVTSNAPAPVSDSDSSIYQYYPVEYATLYDASCLKPGVVNQQNGYWGAYLCANNEHIWLGSFETEEEAAFMAHKTASIEFCDVDWGTTPPQFWSQLSTGEVINMTMDSSYDTNFPNNLMAQVEEKPDSAALPDTSGYNLRRLFMKVLTPSDAGKLNRLVIPKRYAVRHFPKICEDEGVNEDVEVMFFDMSMKIWKFRYCYWNSSQSYVFTRGWNGFLKEKCLKPKDMVIFWAYERSDGMDDVGKLYVIDVLYNNNAGDVTDNGGPSEMLMGQAGDGGLHGNEEIGRIDAQHGGFEEKGVKLFGVNII